VINIVTRRGERDLRTEVVSELRQGPAPSVRASGWASPTRTVPTGSRRAWSMIATTCSRTGRPTSGWKTSGSNRPRWPPGSCPLDRWACAPGSSWTGAENRCTGATTTRIRGWRIPCTTHNGSASLLIHAASGLALL